MRIIAGSLGGRYFDSPHSHRTHPMSDKVRGALFNTLGDVSGLTVLDAFAGSGALSFEAISRGAKNVISIDIDKKAVDVMRDNIRSLDVGLQIKVIRANASGWSDNNMAEQFDIVIAAPPYDDLQLPLINKLFRHVKNTGLYVLDWPGKMNQPNISGFNIIDSKQYGDAQLVFYRRVS